MKLKITGIQELIDNIDYPEKPSEYNFEGYKYRLYEQKDSFLSQEIADSIIPFYLKNVCNKTFSEYYKVLPYDCLQEKTYGFYLGIPYYKVGVKRVSQEEIDSLECRLNKEIESLEHGLNNEIENLNRSLNRKIERFENEKLKPKEVKEVKKHLSNLKSYYRKKEYTFDDGRLDKLIAHTKAKIQELTNTTRKISLQKEIAIIKNELTEKRKKLRSIEDYKKLIDDFTKAKINTITPPKKEIADMQNKLQRKRNELQVFKKYNRIANKFDSTQKNKIDKAQKYKRAYAENDSVADFLCFILQDSFYPFEFECCPTIEYNGENKLLVVDYYLPTIDDTPNIKEIKEYKTKDNEIKYLSKAELNRLYDELIYKIIIRSIAEIFHFDDLKKVDTVCFNGRLRTRNLATGQLMDNCILSVQVGQQEFESIDLNYVDCKACFKHFKGVSGAKLHDQSPIVPLIQLDKTDKRFVEAHAVETDTSTNLATMDWEEFEHLVRELYDLEFNVNGGEVKITQASRDGGVDAVAFDPDPIRGGKIVIQAKRYTNTVGVSAVRDLYGTVINEGANKGILITTSDYGADSYNFAKGKPLTLLNGGHLLFLLEKHNKKARIDLKEAKGISVK